jgi:hypothetical protein
MAPENGRPQVHHQQGRLSIGSILWMERGLSRLGVKGTGLGKLGCNGALQAWLEMEHAEYILCDWMLALGTRRSVTEVGLSIPKANGTVPCFSISSFNHLQHSARSFKLARSPMS